MGYIILNSKERIESDSPANIIRVDKEKQVISEDCRRNSTVKEIFCYQRRKSIEKYGRIFKKAINIIEIYIEKYI